MLKNACVNNAVCPGLKIALPTNRGRSHFRFALILSVYGPFIELSGTTGATLTVFVLLLSVLLPGPSPLVLLVRGESGPSQGFVHHHWTGGDAI